MTYERSFFDDFGDETDNFYAALVGLGGRELCVSIRNQRTLKYYFDAQLLKYPTWLALHAELEVEHFHDTLRGAIACYANDPATIATLMSAVERAIDCPWHAPRTTRPILRGYVGRNKF